MVDITGDDDNDVLKENGDAVSPITIDTSLSTSKEEHESVAADSTSQSQKQLSLSSSSSSSKKASRLSSRQKNQKSVARLNSKRTKLDYDGRFKAAFKDATETRPTT